MKLPKHIVQISRFWRIASALILICLVQSTAFGQSNSYEKQMGEIESIRKSICVNGLWSSACSSDSDDILSCDRKYTGQQAQRICQYEKGLEGRRLAWAFNEIKKRAEAETKQENIRQKAAADAEAKRKIATAQAKELNAKNCITSEFSEIKNILKKTRDISKNQNGKDLIISFDENNLDTDYFVNIDIPEIKSLPEEFRPTLSKTARVIKLATSCDSDAMYYGYKVSLDGKTVDGFLAFRNWNNRPDNVDWWEEINELEWLGPRIKAEEKRLKAVKAESDRLNLEKLKVEADRKAAEEAKAKAQAENYKSFLIWVILVLGLIGAFAIYFWRRPSRKITHTVTDEELSSPADIKYNFTPSTKDQITMQNAFRGKYPFVKYSVRFEHMASFIEGCIKHNAENGSFPSQDEQHKILLKLDSSRV